MNWVLTCVHCQQPEHYFLVVGHAKSRKKFRAYDVCTIRGDSTLFIHVCLHLGIPLPNRRKYMLWPILLAAYFFSHFSHIGYRSAYFFQTLGRLGGQNLEYIVIIHI